jgi:acetyl esterase
VGWRDVTIIESAVPHRGGSVTYAFDPELAAAVPMLPVVDLNDLEKARSLTDSLLAAAPRPRYEPAVEVSEVTVPGPEGAPDVLLRIYRPRGHRPDSASLLPVIYDMHGGGFVLGSPEMADQPNRLLSEQVAAVVVSVDYRLAPEHPFPAGIEDCYAGLVWTAGHAEELGIDPARIVLHGISAGGGLAAGLALLARDRGGPAVAFQYLGVPEVDDRLQTRSMRTFTDTPMWHRPNAIVSWESYLGAGVPGTEKVSPYAAPARATDLTGLPPAYVSAMEFDPLRDESINYALTLLAAGVSVELHLFPGTFHGSGLVASAEISQREVAEEVAVLRRAVGG